MAAAITEAVQNAEIVAENAKVLNLAALNYVTTVNTYVTRAVSGNCYFLRKFINESERPFLGDANIAKLIAAGQQPNRQTLYELLSSAKVIKQFERSHIQSLLTAAQREHGEWARNALKYMAVTSKIPAENIPDLVTAATASPTNAWLAHILLQLP